MAVDEGLGVWESSVSAMTKTVMAQIVTLMAMILFRRQIGHSQQFVEFDAEAVRLLLSAVKNMWLPAEEQDTAWQVSST